MIASQFLDTIEINESLIPLSNFKRMTLIVIPALNARGSRRKRRSTEPGLRNQDSDDSNIKTINRISTKYHKDVKQNFSILCFFNLSIDACVLRRPISPESRSKMAFYC